jgi:N-methylhydantoinase B
MQVETGLDQITVQVVENVLLSIADEMGAVLKRASYSTNIKERADFSTAVFDARGRLVAQAEHIPIHMGGMAGAVKRVLDQTRFPELHAGDVFITNDPYTGGGTHLPDITMVAPVFDDGRLLGFSANIAHHSDIGGHVPGSNSGDSTSIFMEGLRIPLVRLADASRLHQEVIDFILLNSRLPEERKGDLLAQMSALRIGERRIVDTCRKYGADVVQQACEQALEYAERRLRLAVARIPDGVYRGKDYLDADSNESGPIPVQVAITVSGSDIALDFAGTGPQSTFAVNVVRSALEATVYYALKAALDPGIPANGGFFDAVTISAPEGSLVSPADTAPVTARTDACQRVADVVLLALGVALPARIPAESHSTITYVNFSGGDDEFYVYPEVVAGGAGARPSSDGLDAVQVHVTNSSNLPVESLEAEYPLRVERYELITDSGGAGEYRGGLGIRRDIRILSQNAEFSAHADRHNLPPRGAAGGKDGTPGRFIVRPGTSDERVLPGGRVSGIELRHGDIMRIEGPGSGGYGDPRRRDTAALHRDVLDGRVSAQSARDDYDASGAIYPA